MIKYRKKCQIQIYHQIKIRNSFVCFQVDLPEESNVVKGNMKFTENKVPSYMLSEEVEEMCYDTDVYWMECE